MIKYTERDVMFLQAPLPFFHHNRLKTLERVPSELFYNCLQNSFFRRLHTALHKCTGRTSEWIVHASTVSPLRRLHETPRSRIAVKTAD